MNGDIGTPQRELRVPMEIGRLNSATKSLEESLLRLAERLNGVLSPVVPVPDTNEAKPLVSTRKDAPLVEQLSEVSASVHRVRSRIDDLCARLEV